MSFEVNPADEEERPWTGIFEDELSQLRRDSEALARVVAEIERHRGDASRMLSCFAEARDAINEICDDLEAVIGDPNELS